MALWSVGMFGMFFLGALYLQRILGYDALEVGLAFLPVTVVMGTLSLALRGPAAACASGRARADPEPGLDRSPACSLFARAPVDGDYVTDVLPVMVLLGARRRRRRSRR